jgi:von Willebrand factor type A domain
MTTLDIRVDRARVAVREEFAIAISTPELAADPGASSEFVLAIDASPSMAWPALAGDNNGPTRWDLARRGATALVGGLGPGIRVHVVAFAGEPRLITEGTAGSLRTRLEGLLPARVGQERDGTNLEKILHLGYELLRKSPATSRRMILLSDGEPTMGERSPDRLGALTQAAAAEDVYTDPIGLGAEANVDLLLRLAAGGPCDHVASQTEADRILRDVMRRLSEIGQRVAASGGELRIQVSPYFPVLGVYQIMQARRIIEGPRPGSGGAASITIPLGAIGSGDERPVFALKLRGPEGTSRDPLLVVQADATVRTRNGPAEYTGRATVEASSAPDPRPDLVVLDKIREVELEAETAEQLRASPEGGYEHIYEQASKQASSAGLSELAAQYRDAVSSLRSGMASGDVIGTQRATSSRSTTTPRRVLRETPLKAPATSKRPGPRHRASAGGDWIDDEPAPPPPASRRDDVTEHGDAW